MKPIAIILTLTVVMLPAGAGFAQNPVAGGQLSGMPGGPQVQQGALYGGIPAGKPTGNVLSLSIRDAVDRGLKYNLGIILRQQDVRAAEGSRLLALSKLLPQVTTRTSEAVEQVNLASVGFSGFPGINPIVGPFGVFDTRASLSQTLLDLNKMDEYHAGSDNLRAAEFSYQHTRDLVVLVCLQLYLQAVAGDSRIEARQAQLRTAQALYELAVSRRSTGLVPGIDVLRAQVEMQAQQQRLIVAENDFAKQKLGLAQAIGLPLGQEILLSDRLGYAPLSGYTPDKAVEDAYHHRSDYQGAMAQVKAAEESRQAAVRRRAPTLDLDADYGVIGQRPFMSHGSFSVAVSLNIPIFQGRETDARIRTADAALEQRKADLESLRARIYYEIQTAFLDLKSSEDRVKVAKSNLDLAQQQVVQAQDRFSAGVVNNVEVVQAQGALATATEDYISSLYDHNLAKAGLAEALGVAETQYQQILMGK